MKIELKKIQYAAFASEETSCFSADIYIDGIKSLNVRNEGHGGCNFYHEYVKGSKAKLEEHCASLPSVEFYGSVLEMDADLFIGELLETWLVERDVKRRLSREMLYTKKGRDGIFSLKAKVKYSPALATMLRNSKPDTDKILNELPIAEAVAIVKANEKRKEVA